MKRICKYCNSEMDLMESEPNCEFWVCINEDCNATLTLDEQYDWDNGAMRIKKCKICGNKLGIFYVKGGFCSFKCKIKWNKINEKWNIIKNNW